MRSLLLFCPFLIACQKMDSNTSATLNNDSLISISDAGKKQISPYIEIRDPYSVYFYWRVHDYEIKNNAILVDTGNWTCEAIKESIESPQSEKIKVTCKCYNPPSLKRLFVTTRQGLCELNSKKEIDYEFFSLQAYIKVYIGCEEK